MTVKVRAIVTCDGDGCANHAEGDPDVVKLGFAPMSLKGTGLEGWHDVGGGKHLCPRCWPAFEAFEAEHRRRRDEMLGVRRADVEV